MGRTIWAVAAVTLGVASTCAALVGCEASRFRQANDNPLLGNWVLASGPTGCSQRLAFSARLERAWIDGQRHDMDVTEYLVQPDKTFAVGSDGPDHAVPFEFLRQDRMMLHGPEGTCVWDRE